MSHNCFNYKYLTIENGLAALELESFPLCYETQYYAVIAIIIGLR